MTQLENRSLNISEPLGWIGVILGGLVICGTVVGYLVMKWWPVCALGLLVAAEFLWIGASEIWRRHLYATEDGLCVTRPLGKTHMEWKEISRVRVTRSRDCQRIKRISIVAIKPSRSPMQNRLQGGQAKVIVVSGAAPDADAVIDILEEHVPDAIQEIPT